MQTFEPAQIWTVGREQVPPGEREQEHALQSTAAGVSTYTVGAELSGQLGGAGAPATYARLLIRK
jgi:hypothetical protein